MHDNFVKGEVRKVLFLESKEAKKGMYFDVMFRLTESGSHYRSCIWEHCRNYDNWKGLLNEGNILGNLKLLQHKSGKLFVDADSVPILLREGDPTEIKENKFSLRKENSEIQLKLF